MWRNRKRRTAPNDRLAMTGSRPSSGFVTMPAHRVAAVPVQVEQQAVEPSACEFLDPAPDVLERWRERRRGVHEPAIGISARAEPGDQPRHRQRPPHDPHLRLGERDLGEELLQQAIGLGRAKGALVQHEAAVARGSRLGGADIVELIWPLLTRSQGNANQAAAIK